MYLVSDDPTAVGIVRVTAENMTASVTGVWSLIIAFPGNILGRLLPLAFMAVMFAGEYQWGTLRQIVPRSRRSSLILAKVATTTFIVLLSYILTSLIIGAGQAAGHALLGLDYRSIFAGDEQAQFGLTYFQHLLLGALSLLMLAGFTAEPALVVSLIALGLWVVVPVALAIILFNRQDITS